MADRRDRRQPVETSHTPASDASRAPHHLRVGVLGPVTVSVDGVDRPVTARRQRAVLACLALHLGEAVSADRLLDEVWGDDLPDTGARAVAYQISKLRSLLEPDRDGEGSIITTTAAGYVLGIASNDVDALRFERLVENARATLTTDPSGCERALTDALTTWRGRPFAGLDDEPFVDREARRLEQLRVAARRTLAEARLALDRADEVVGELETMIADDPLDESLTALLMSALDRCGRTADALRAYGVLRQRLSAELGIEPSNDLRQLEQQLLAGGGGGDAAPTTSGHDRPPRPIPAAASSFVGRTAELVEIQEWLTSARVVSLCGFGGLGKTRLAQEVARAMSERFADGVWYVDLAPISDASVLADAILTAGGYTVPRNRDPVERLLEVLAGSEVLVVLDNCEHLAHDVAEIATGIVREAPRVRVLATSRVHLGATDEAIYAVRPLDDRSATELFVDRARLARPGFTVDDTNRTALHRICERLDGIPLAIELAAARVAVMSLEQLTEHLADRLELLTDIRPDSDTRQHSLNQVMDWSYRLLEPDDRRLLRRMSTCVGGFDLDAAVHVGGLDPTAVSITDVLDRLDHLVHASLVIVDTEHGAARYRILEPVRQYATGRLDPDEHHHTGHAHAHHYATVAANTFDLWSSDYLAARRTGELELGNLRAAMSWCYHHDHPHLGLSIARDARSHFFTNQSYRELLSWLQTGLDLIGDDDDDTLGAAGVACAAASDLADLDAHRTAFMRVQRGIDSVRDPRLRADLLSARSSFFLKTDPRRAERDMREAIEMRSSVPIRAVALLNNRVDQSWLVGSLDDGPTLLGRCEEVIGAMSGAEPTHFKIEAGIAACDARWDDVLRVTEGAQHLYPMLEASVLTLRAEALAALGHHHDALTALARVDPDSYERHQRVVDRLHAAIDLRRGERRAAAERLTVLADEITRDGRRLAAGVHVASLLAVAAHDLDQDETAAILFGHAAAERARLDIMLRPSERTLTASARDDCRAALGSERFEELTARGAHTEWCDLPRVDTDDGGRET